MHRFEAGLHTGRWLVIGSPGDIFHGLEFSRVAFQLETINFPFQIVLADLQQMRGDFFGFGVDFSGCHGNGCARYWGRARAISSQPIRCGAGVAFFDLDHLRRQTQFCGDDLRIGGLMSLALRNRTHACDGAAGRVDANLAGIEHAYTQDVAHFGRAGADYLGERHQAYAHQRRRIWVGAGFSLLGTQPFVIHRLEHLIERGLIIAGIIFKTERGGVRELRLADEIFAANFGFVYIQFLRQHIHHALDQIHRLGDAERAAIGYAARGFVGIDPINAAVSRRDVVGAGDDMEHAGREFGWVCTRIECAMIGNHVDPQTGDLAFFGRRQFTLHVVIAGEAGRGNVLDAILYPFHRPPQHDGGHNGANIARVNRHLVAESTAYIR